MLQFAVYDKTGLALDWPMVNPYLMGPEDLPVRGKITFRDGYIRCEGPDGDALSLCVQYETETMGRLMLQTCLLPPHKKPYVLSVELARHRIKLFIAKSEEWQMFDLSNNHPAIRHWEEARRLFTEAITADTPYEAEQAARFSLIHALVASERLAMAHAEVLLHRRFGTKAAGSATLGIRICPKQDGPKIKELLSKAEFDIIVIPIRWNEIEAEEGKFDWGVTDRWVEWARELEKPIVMGPLLDFSKRSLPEWMNVWKHDYDTCRDHAYDFVEQVVGRYKAVVGIWNIASGLNLNDHFEFTSDQMIDLTRMVVLHVRQARPGARTMLELVQPFGEYCTKNRDAVSPFHFVDRVMREGIRFDALGVQLLFGRSEGGMHTRDIMQISSMLDRFFLLEVPVFVSALGVPSMTVDDWGGWWRGKWDPEIQSKWITQVFALAMSKPFVESIFWTDLVDHEDARFNGAGLINSAGQLKPSFTRFRDLRKRLRKPLGKLTLPKKQDMES